MSKFSKRAIITLGVMFIVWVLFSIYCIWEIKIQNEKMENTIENKVKFFAQYYGQNVFCNDALELFRLDHSCFIGLEGHEYLSLKPLSSITDEDAVESVRIITGGETGWSSKRSIEGDRLDLDKVNENLTIWFDGEILFDDDFGNQLPLERLSAYDFLRSRGYALPFMGLSIEKQIEYGWVKLK